MEIEEKNLTTFDGSEFPLESDRMQVTLHIVTDVWACGIVANKQTDTTSTSTRK